VSQLQQRMTALISGAGYRSDEPIVVGIQQHDAPPVLLAQGLTSTSEPVTATTLMYAASLSKQMTAACAALLARRGALDMESPLSHWLPGLPAWADTIRLRHGQPGTEHVYSNAGYVCLAAVVERAADMPLPDFARRHLFVPLAMTETRYWSGPDPAPPGAAPLVRPHPAPLSLGDGGVWTTLGDLLRWGQALNVDELGVSGLMQTPGRLDDGTPIDYAWGIGVRSHGGHRVYRHGGGWTGLRALHARLPDLDLSVALVALDDHTERRVPLLDSLLDEATEARDAGDERRAGL
ncbi:beta-lactamase family protein, partial [Nonomuraea sp. RK-328]|nr:beta-lactamase family protein [Nonomuraea sp. RK-328]